MHYPQRERGLTEDLSLPLYATASPAFNLNTRLMRRGSTMYSRFHNNKLADLLIAEAVTWEE